MCLYLAHAEYIFAVISNNQTFSVMEKKTEQRKTSFTATSQGSPTGMAAWH